MVAERRSAPKPRKKGRERLAESAEKSARTVRNKLRETPGGGGFGRRVPLLEIHGIGAALWKICRHTHFSICAYSHPFMGRGAR